MDTQNAKAGGAGASSFAAGYDTWLAGLYTNKWGMIGEWVLFPVQLLLPMAVPKWWFHHDRNVRRPRTSALLFTVSALSTLLLLLISWRCNTLLYNNEWLTQTSAQWGPFFPSCNVNMQVWGNNATMLLWSMVLSGLSLLGNAYLASLLIVLRPASHYDEN